MTPATVAGLIAAAREHIENLSPDEVSAELAFARPILVDIRETEERVSSGAIPGAIHAARGMLEFYADSSSPYHRPEFETDRRIILYCASGGRSALGAISLASLGFDNVAHLDGGFKAWTASESPVESVSTPLYIPTY